MKRSFDIQLRAELGLTLSCPNYIALVYYSHTLDRANLGNAKTMGLEKDLGLVNNEYSLVLILFYIPYGLCNIPAALYVAPIPDYSQRYSHTNQLL